MRLALDCLGPTFVKLGQILSTRSDLLPTAYTLELAKLQDSAPAVPAEEILQALTEELGGVEVAGLVQEFATTLRAELDYLKEARNAERFAASFQDDPRVHIPRVLWETTTSRVRTLERVHGMKIDDLAAVDAAGVDRREPAARGRRPRALADDLRPLVRRFSGLSLADLWVGASTPTSSWGRSWPRMRSGWPASVTRLRPWPSG